MCDKKDKVWFRFNSKVRRYLDKCMIPMIKTINEMPGYKTLASCCGHGIFNPTCIIARVVDYKIIAVKEHFSGIDLPIKRNYYAFDKQRKLYYIPEIVKLERSKREGSIDDLIIKLLRAQRRELTTRSIALKVGVDWAVAKKYLDNLQKNDQVEKRIDGRKTYWKLVKVRPV